MNDDEIFCPYCGSKTPKVNFCANCGHQIKDIDIESTEDPASVEEAITVALTVTDMSKSKFRGEVKNIFFSTNYLLEDESSRVDYLGNVVSTDYGYGDINQVIYEAIDIQEIKQERPYLNIFPYTEIEKAEFYTTRWNTYLEIEAPLFTRKYILGAEKFHELFFKKISNILQPKMGDRFVVK